ncbi:MAG: hypothetical protein KF819_38070, partial [Labilithrix sp.]|nr:hypothetical protein [Labilithrix sp.]
MTLAFVVLFYAFAKGTAHIRVLTGPITMMVWSVTILFVVVLVTLYTCVFFKKPRDLSSWLDDGNPGGGGGESPVKPDAGPASA